MNNVDCTFPREEMASALARLAGVIPSRTTLPVLSCVRVAATDDCSTLVLEATDHSQHAETRVELAERCEAFDPFCLPLDAFLGVAKAQRGVSGRLLAKGDAVELSSAGSKSRMGVVPAREFPSLAFLGETFADVGNVPAEAMREAFAAVRYAIFTENTTKPALMGVRLETEEGRLLAVACNGPALAKEIICEFSETFKAATIPTSSVGAFFRMFPNGADVLVSRTDERVRFTGAGGTLTLPTLDSPFPDWRPVVPINAPITAQVERAALLDAVSRLQLVHRERAAQPQPRCFDYGPSAITVTAERRTRKISAVRGRMIAIARAGMCLHDVTLSEPCALCQIVSDANGATSGIPDYPDATVHVECALCENMVEVRTGCRGIDDALSHGWSLDGSGDLMCVWCTEARADLIGDETC